MAQVQDSFLNGSNAAFVAELYSHYLKSPGSVEPSWAAFFEELREDGRVVLRELRGASWASPEDGGRADFPSVPDASLSADSFSTVRAATLDSIRALMMIRSYRVRGHLIARFDPLGLEGNDFHPELDPGFYGFTEADMDRPIFIDHVLGLEVATIREILQVLKETYCSSVGIEFMHIQDPDEKAWIQCRIESVHNRSQFTPEGKRAIYERLAEAEGFEKFLHVKYAGNKRFGLDGGEALIPALEQILKRGSQLGIGEVVLGMSHRGRLNVLAGIMHKPYEAIISEFQGNPATPEGVLGSGDVKYHMGTSANRVFDGNKVHLSLTANPSHLEAVNCVVLGKVRAKQAHKGDNEHKQVMGILMHGDSAFAGQGLVSEALVLSGLKGYKVGGTIHLIVNNQIGFTTSPGYSRSSPYPSDVAKMIQAPIFHVNGDDPEAVVHAARIITEFRQEFGRDVVLDMFCYRRHGHNEGDEPMFTQPVMYSAIAKHPTTREIYGRQLANEGVLAEDGIQRIGDSFRVRLEKAFEAGHGYRPNKADWLEGKWDGLVQMAGEEEMQEFDTAASMELLKSVGKAITNEPSNVTLNSKISRLLKKRRKMVESGKEVDWGMGEALAFGTLLAEGTPVRLSGQDCGRGTFSHRHSVLVDQKNEQHYIPLNNICKGQGYFEVVDSPLSEAGVLGFEYGYSSANPKALVIWEAQFGDFANGAQVIIDQFICSGESKWLRMSGVTMLLPHGYEGQGPEHSSARPERYLQLCAENNIQVCNLTSPAQLFHALRRQILRNFRKPLIVFSPKSLLRHKLAVSDLDQMGPGSHFCRVLSEVDNLVSDKKVRRVVLCSGKVYYDLLQARRSREIDDVAIVRVEQLYPWPRQSILKQLSRYAEAEVVWCQEEPANMGYWAFVCPRLTSLMEELGVGRGRLVFAGREASASPATGLLKVHKMEQETLLEQALATPLDAISQPFR